MKVREQYLISEFKDFTGKERSFVICALSYTEEYSKPLQELFDNLRYKTVTFGIAVQNHGDEFSLEKGKAMALNHAEMKPFNTITSDRTYSLNYDTIEAFLRSFEKYFQQDPSMFIPTYKTHKLKYEENPKEYLERREFQLNKEKKIKDLQKELKDVKSSVYTPSKETKFLKA